MRQPAVDLPHALVIHLIGAVEDDDELPERVSEILRRLRLSRPRGTRGGAAEEHPERLRQRDVADVRQRRDHEAFLHAEVLVRVLEIHVADRDDHRVHLVAPVKTALLRPLEVSDVANFFLHEVLRGVSLMHVHRDHRLEVLAFVLSEVRARRDDDHLLQEAVLLLKRFLHGRLILLRDGERALHVRGPEELNPQKRNLRRVPEDERLQILLVHGRVGHLDDAANRALHAVDERLEPHLDVPLRDDRPRFEDAVDVFDEFHALALLRKHLQHLRLVHLVERHLGQGVEQTGLEVRRHRLRVRTQGQNLQQRRVGDEVKARELGSLRVQKRRERLLAQLELLRENRQRVRHEIVHVAHLHDVLRLHRVLNRLDELLVDVLKPLRLERELLHDVPAAEHRLHVHPHVLHDEPHLDDLAHGGQLRDPLVDFFLERRGVPVRGHGPERHLRVFELFDELRGGRDGEAHLASVLIRLKRKRHLRPVGVDRRELGLHLRLLDRARGELLHLLRDF